VQKDSLTAEDFVEVFESKAFLFIKHSLKAFLLY